MKPEIEARTKLFDELAEWAHGKMSEQLKAKYTKPAETPKAPEPEATGGLDDATLQALKGLIGE